MTKFIFLNIIIFIYLKNLTFLKGGKTPQFKYLFNFENMSIPN